MGGGEIPAIEAELAGQGYGVLKDRTADAVIATLEPIQKEFDKLIADKDYVQKVMNSGAERAQALAQRTLRKVYKKVGFAAR